MGDIFREKWNDYNRSIVCVCSVCFTILTCSVHQKQQQNIIGRQWKMALKHKEHIAPRLISCRITSSIVDVIARCCKAVAFSFHICLLNVCVCKMSICLVLSETLWPDTNCFSTIIKSYSKNLAILIAVVTQMVCECVCFNCTENVCIALATTWKMKRKNCNYVNGPTFRLRFCYGRFRCLQMMPLLQ